MRYRILKHSQRRAAIRRYNKQTKIIFNKAMKKYYLPPLISMFNRPSSLLEKLGISLKD